VARAVARELSVQLGATSDPLVTHGTTDALAHELLLRGKSYRSRYTLADFRTAIKYFEQAIARDSNYAEAWAWLGSSHTLLTVFASAPVSQELPIARAAVSRALLLDSALADAHWMLGEIMSIQDRDFASAIREWRRSLELDPKNVSARFFLARGIMAEGHVDEALSMLFEALRTDPLASEVMLAIGSMYAAPIPLDTSRHLHPAARLDSAV